MCTGTGQGIGGREKWPTLSKSRQQKGVPTAFEIARLSGDFRQVVEKILRTAEGKLALFTKASEGRIFFLSNHNGIAVFHLLRVFPDLHQTLC